MLLMLLVVALSVWSIALRHVRTGFVKVSIHARTLFDTQQRDYCFVDHSLIVSVPSVLPLWIILVIAVVGSLVVVILLLLLLISCCCRRQNDRKINLASDLQSEL